MRYRKPFTIEQRRDATRRYRSFRQNYRTLHSVFAPATASERKILRDYRDLIRAFGVELKKPGRQVNPAALNDLDAAAKSVFLLYMEQKLHRRLQDEEP